MIRSRSPGQRRPFALGALPAAALALGALPAAALTLVTCSAHRPALAPPPAAPAPAPAPPPLPVIASAAPAPAPAHAPEPHAPGTITAQALDLPAFVGRLCDLRSGARHDHVRVAWLGDSHTAADLWTGAFRRRLQEHYGNGGPGFLHLGWKTRSPIRHEGVSFGTRARWRLEPPTYAQTKRYDDGVFGLGGVRTLPVERDARARVEVSDPALRGESLRWTLTFRPVVASASADVVLGDGHQHRLLADKPGRGAPGPPQQRSFRGPDAFEVRGGRGFQFFGVIAEAEAPGVVVDTLGLNGARLATLLAYDEGAWVAELARRRPDLVALAYGTNESQEPPGDPGRFGETLDAVLDRVRKAAPSAECLVVLPMERGERAAQERLAAVSASLAARARARRCAVWDTRAAMGGPGSYAAWQRETPQRAADDGVHLKARGYVALGEALARDVLESASRCEQRPSAPGERPVP